MPMQRRGASFKPPPQFIDNTCSTVVEYTYDTWGKVLSCTGTLATTLGSDQPFRYRGYVYDTETGWYYLQSRYYDPSIGRFISADVLLSTGQGVLGHNSFAYCLGNPVNPVDPSWYSSFWDNLKNALTVVAVVAIAVAAVALTAVAVIGTGGMALALVGGSVAASAATAATVATAAVATGAVAAAGVAAVNIGQNIAYSAPRYPGNNPNESPGDDWKWRGKGNQGGDKGNYTNPNTGESLHPDLNHPNPIGPHWDYKDPFGKWWRLLPDGRVLPK